MLQPKRVEAYRDVWRQLKANGYDVIPLFTGKDNPPKDWPNLPNDEASIARWNGRAAAIRMLGSGLLVIDLDTRIEAVRDAVLAMLEERWPAFMATCLRRHSGAVKLGLIGRATTDLRTMQTHSYYPDPENLDKEQKNQVELFTGNSRKYFGVHGAHSAGREYGYRGRSILDVPADELPEFPAADLGAMLDACDAVMKGCGLFAPRPDKSSGGDEVVYDLTPEQVFRLSDDTELTLLELEDLVDQDGKQEGYATIFDPKADTNDRVKANLSRTGLALWDTKTEVSHRWAHRKPIEPEQFAERLAEAGIEMESGPPNWRERTASGKFPRASFHNAKLAIESGGLICVEDTFHYKTLIGCAGPPLPPFAGIVDDACISMLRGWLSDRYGFDLTEKHVRDAVINMAHANRFNPVTDMLADAEANWDKVERLDRMAVDYFNCPDTELNRQCVRKTMIAAVARARQPGCKFDTILVLEGPEGFNKSTAWQVLAGEDNFSDERIIGHASREVQEQLAGVWIHESADLAGMKKAEVEIVKAFASRTVDRARPAYGHFLVAQPRHSIEVGTTNSSKYLPSPTGNRRFWPMLVQRCIDLAKLRAARLQLWGEAAAAQSAGESIVLDERLWGLAAIEQEARRVVHPWEAILADMKVRAGGLAVPPFVIERVGDEDGVSSHDIFNVVLKVPPSHQHRGHTMTVSEIMERLGWRHQTVRIDGNPVKGYARPVSAHAK